MPSPADDPALADTIPQGEGSTVLARARAAADAVDVVVDDARASIPAWDNLAFISAFCRAAERAREALATSTHAVERRMVGRRLLRLVPLALLPEPLRERRALLTLPDVVAARADDDFALRPDDAPRVHPSWTAFLTRATIADDVQEPGRHEWLLAPRSFSPKDAAGSAMLVRVIGDAVERSGSDSVVPSAARGALKQVEIKNPGGHTSRRRRTSDGKDAGPAELRADVLSSWLRHAGPSARGLDLRRAEDRCLLLNYNAVVRERRLDALLTRPAPEDGERRAAVVAALIDAAIDVLALSALDPLACRFVFPGDEAQAAWVEQAITMITALGVGAELMPLA